VEYRTDFNARSGRDKYALMFYAGNTVTTTFYFGIYFRTRLHISTACSHFQAIVVIKYKGKLLSTIEISGLQLLM
jgi:hypothetical protein